MPDYVERHGKHFTDQFFGDNADNASTFGQSGLLMQIYNSFMANMNLYVHGRPGTGKSYVFYHVNKFLKDNGKKSNFIEAEELYKNPEKYLDALRKGEILFIDEFAIDDKNVGNSIEQTQLFTTLVVGESYEKGRGGSIFFSSNHSPEHIMSNMRYPGQKGTKIGNPHELDKEVERGDRFIFGQRGVYECTGFGNDGIPLLKKIGERTEIKDYDMTRALRTISRLNETFNVVGMANYDIREKLDDCELKMMKDRSSPDNDLASMFGSIG